MFGGLHIKTAARRSLGSLLKDSGWTGALVEAGVLLLALHIHFCQFQVSLGHDKCTRSLTAVFTSF